MSTIFALSSGALPAAIAVFRLSGSRSLPALQEITGRQRWNPREMRFTKIWTEDRELLDTAMAVYLPGPSTFTGEDTAEVSVHGSRAVASAMAHRLSSIDGIRQARRGEFVKRAFYNGKLDLSSVRGLSRLIEAETERQRRLSYGQMRGGEEVRRIRDQLTEAIMRSFLLMDFGEHVDTTTDEIHSIIAPLLPALSHLSNRSRGAELVHRGLSVVLLGRPNTGKSSLLNVLAERDVAIVSSRAGTTRDSLEVRISVAGVPMTLTDTAGLRDSEDELENEGMRRARERLRLADMALLVIDSQSASDEVEQLVEEVESHCERRIPMILVRNKADLGSPRIPATPISTDGVIIETVDTCALTREGSTPLLSALSKAVSRMCPDDNDGPCLADHKLIEEVHSILLECVSTSDAARLCARLEEALSLLGEMAGETTNEAVLDKLFQQFCIGK